MLRTFILSLIFLMILGFATYAEEFEPWFLKIESRDIPLRESITQSVYLENRKPAGFSTSTPLNAIALYHRFLSRSRCHFYPSCSRYGYRVISKYGLIRGMIMESERLTRCNGKAHIYGYEQIGKFLYDPPRDFWHYKWEDKRKYSAAELVQTKLITKQKAKSNPEDVSDELVFQLLDERQMDSNVKFAFYLYNERDLYRAVTEFKRYMFKNPDSDLVSAIYFMLALCYFQAERYDEALRYFRWAKANSPQNEFQALTRYMQGVSLYLSGDYGNAIQTFDAAAESENISPKLVEKAFLFSSLCFLRNNDIPNANQRLQKIASSCKDPEIKQSALEAISIIEEGIDKGKKSPVLSMVMSTILPGAGQIYSERFRDGIISLAVNSAFTTIAVNSYKRRYWGGGIIVGYFGLPFYIGNIYGAKASAHRHNEQIMDEMIEQIEQLLNTQKLSMDARTQKNGVYVSWSLIE